MRETPKARQAFADYLAMGSGRSLEKLLEQYRQQSGSGTSVPSLRYRTLADWSRAHNWQTRLVEIAEQERQAVIARGIAEKQNRIDALNDRWLRMRRVIEERAEHHPNVIPEAAGADTGLMVLTIRYLPNGTRVEEWAVDTGVLKELREHEKQAAIEMGEWTEKREDTLNATESFIAALREFGRGCDA